MSQGLIVFILIAFFFFLLMGFFIFGDYVEKEQEHRHKIELEKAKQGIFDPPTPKDSFFKKYGKHIIITLGITFLIIIICYIFKIPSNLPKYILEVIK